MNGRRPTKLRELNRIWREKLKTAGFKDIENEREEFVDHHTLLDLAALSGFRTHIWTETRDYYYWAEHMLTLCKFESARDKRIWARHSRGESSRDIEKFIHLDNTMISREIKRIRLYLIRQRVRSDEDEAA